MILEDFSDKQLLEILLNQIKEMGLQLENNDDKYARVAIRRLGESRGNKVSDVLSFSFYYYYPKYLLSSSFPPPQTYLIHNN
jgi:hypothetical protein